MAPPHISICPAERGDSYLRSLENTSGVQIVFYSQIVDIVSSYLQCDAIILNQFLWRCRLGVNMAPRDKDSILYQIYARFVIIYENAYYVT